LVLLFISTSSCLNISLFCCFSSVTLCKRNLRFFITIMIFSTNFFFLSNNFISDRMTLHIYSSLIFYFWSACGSIRSSNGSASKFFDIDLVYLCSDRFVTAFSQKIEYPIQIYAYFISRGSINNFISFEQRR